MLSREDYVLLLISLPGGRYDLDRIRVMKGMFLLAEEAPDGMPKLHNFKAYDWGPFSPDVYDDLDTLERRGLIAVEGGVRHRYETYRATSLGQVRAAQLIGSLPKPVAEKVAEVKNLVTSMPFLHLLEYVYDRHPDYAKRSKLRR